MTESRQEILAIFLAFLFYVVIVVAEMLDIKNYSLS